MFKVTYQLLTVTTNLNWAVKGTISLKKAMSVLLCHQGILESVHLEAHFWDCCRNFILVCCLHSANNS